MLLGTTKKVINLEDEYVLLAKEDEKVAQLLKYSKQYRHSIYFYIQAMEKLIRAKIFSKVNPDNEYFRDSNRHHSIESSGDFLLQIYCVDSTIKNQIKKMFDDAIFSDIHFNKLHNNLRYPFYNNKNKYHLMCQYTDEDCTFIENKLKNLKSFLNDLDKLLY